VPSHVALAFVGIEQPVHDEVPQFAVLLLLTQLPEQSWNPAAQADPHVPAVHVAGPLAGAPHRLAQDPQYPGSIEVFAQMSPH
jgi:hypothetical protein